MEIFIKNKYTKWYYNIINSSNIQENEYSERHHIIPKSLGGNNKSSNIVRLSAREHFICHLLLTKMVDGNSKHKMVFALHMMMSMRRNYQFRHLTNNSKIFEYYRKEYSKAVSFKRKNTLGWHHSEETKEKIRQGNKNKIIPNEQRNKISQTLKGNVPAFKGCHHTNETLKLISEKLKGIIPPNKGKKMSVIAIENNKKAQQKFIYTIKSPTNSIFEISDLKGFCVSNQLPYDNLRGTFKTGNPIKNHGNLKLKNSIGWQCIAIQDK